MNPPVLIEKWYRITDWILDKCERFPKHTRFGLAGRIAALSIDTLELFTEASYSKEKRSTLICANKNLEKLRILFRLSFDRRYINMAQYEFISTELNNAGKMCGGWIKSCNE